MPTYMYGSLKRKCAFALLETWLGEKDLGMRARGYELIGYKIPEALGSGTVHDSRSATRHT